MASGYAESDDLGEMPAGVPGRSVTACISVFVAMLAVGAFLAVADDEGDPLTFDEVSSVGSLPLRTIEASPLAAAGLSLEWCLVGRVAPSSSQGQTLSSSFEG